MDDTPAFSRQRSSDGQTTELRGDTPLLYAQVLDAVATARRTNRTALVNQILGDWVRQQLHEASLVHRVTRGNPDAADFAPPGAE